MMAEWHKKLDETLTQRLQNQAEPIGRWIRIVISLREGADPGPVQVEIARAGGIDARHYPDLCTIRCTVPGHQIGWIADLDEVEFVEETFE